MYRDESALSHVPEVTQPILIMHGTADPTVSFKDFTVRFYEFFDHYLKGAPAPKWMTDGVPFLKKGVAGSPRSEERQGRGWGTAMPCPGPVRWAF